jgi:hypothetical protein
MLFEGWASVAAQPAAPNPLTCAGYPEPRIFLEGQAWWIRTPGRNGHDFGHIHIGTCFPQAATLSGTLEADLRLILHNNPGVVDEIVVKVRNDDDNYTDLYRQVNNGWACLGTCERWEHVTLDTRRLPTDGIKEFIFEVFVDEPDGKSLLGAVVFRNQVANGKVVNPHFTDYAARGVARYKEFGYSYSRFLSNLPSQPVRGVYAFEVQLNNRPSPAEAAGLSYDVLLDANFHAGIMGTVLKEGKGNFTGQLTLDTTRLENGPHRLLLRMHSNDGSAGSTLSSVLVIPFTVDNPGGNPPNPPSTPSPTLAAPTATPVSPTPTLAAPTATPLPPTKTPGNVSGSASLEAGQSMTLTCPTRLVTTLSKDRKSVVVKCLTPTPTPSPMPSATRTSAPPTATPMPTQTATSAPAATVVPPSATPLQPTSTPGGAALPSVDPIILGTCPAAVHDRYTVVGPDGNVYRTWHPQTVPVDPNDASKGTCALAHEHGDDPRTSLANSSLPPFGYIGLLAGDNEPHEGFKIFVSNRGVVNDEGRDARTSTRIVAHMGTGGVKRFSTRLHSLMFDLVSPAGHYAHVQGMADTGGVGSICDSPRAGKTVTLVPGMGCDPDSLYEIWGFELSIGDKVTVIVATAAFDPITVLDPANPTRLVYTVDAFAERARTDAIFRGPFHGCDREGYHGPVYWYNAGGPTVYYTNAYGNIVPGGALRQEISAHSAIGIPMSPDQTAFKLRRSHCAPGLGLKN